MVIKIINWYFQFDPIIAVLEEFHEYGDLKAINDSKEYLKILENAQHNVEDICKKVKEMKAEYVIQFFKY